MVNRGDAVKLYIIERALNAFGDGSVSRLRDDIGGLELYCYLPPHMGRKDAMAYLEESFAAGLFHDGSVLSGVNVAYERISSHGGAPDEQMHCVTFVGSLTELADNVERNDPAGFAAAQKSQRAMVILQREKAIEQRQGGI